MPAKNKFDREMVLYFLNPIGYWYRRFQKTRNIDDFDRAQLFVEALHELVPESCFLRNLSFVGFLNLYDAYLSVGSKRE